MPRILIVDDEEPIRRLLGRVLQVSGYEMLQAASAQEARELLTAGRHELILCDVGMPGESGLDLARDVLSNWPDTAVVMVTALDDPMVAETALKMGAYGYIIKPFQVNEVLISVKNAVLRRELEMENRRHREELAQLVRQRTATLEETVDRLVKTEQELLKRETSLEQSLRNLSLATEGIILAIVKTVETRDPYTASHQQRVAELGEAIARELGMSDDEIQGIRMTGMIHDLGKISIPAEILSKPGRLSEVEFSLIKTHAQVGFDILASIEFPWPVARMVLEHHERMDGSGYPHGISGEGLLRESRILAVADVVEAMASHRPYWPALELDKALEEIQGRKGTLYDRDVVDACAKVLKGGYKLS